MTEVEQQLRDMLSRYAHEAPDGHLMLARVRQTAAQRRRRGRVLTATAALAVVLTASGVVAFAGRSGPPQPKLSVGLGQDLVGVVFVAGSPVDLTFPFTPPAAPVPGTRPMLRLVAGRPTLQYLPPDAGTIQPQASVSALATATAPAKAASKQGPGTELDAGPSAGSKKGPNADGGNVAVPRAGSSASGGATPLSQPDRSTTAGNQTGGNPTGNALDQDRLDQAATDPVTVVTSASPWVDGPFTPTVPIRSTTVRGGAGVIGERPSGDGPPDYVLSWTVPGGPWVGISAPETISTVELTGFASELDPQPITQPGPFDFDLTPEGFSVDNINASSVTFRPPGVAASADFVGKLVVSLDAEPSGAQDGRPVKVGGRAGWLHTVDEATILRVDEGNGFSLEIQVPERLRIDEPDLLRFAAGVHITAAASPARG